MARKLTPVQSIKNKTFAINDRHFDVLWEHHAQTDAYHTNGLTPRFSDALDIGWKILEKARVKAKT